MPNVEGVIFEGDSLAKFMDLVANGVPSNAEQDESGRILSALERLKAQFPRSDPDYFPDNLLLRATRDEADELRAKLISLTALVNSAGLSPAQEPKYSVRDGAIFNRASGKDIPADEPIFIFRARDYHAREAIEAYAAVLPPGEHRDAVTQRVADFATFSQTHPERMKEPDTSPGDGKQTRADNVMTHLSRRLYNNDSWSGWSLINAVEYEQRKDDPSFDLIPLAQLGTVLSPEDIDNALESARVTIVSGFGYKYDENDLKTAVQNLASRHYGTATNISAITDKAWNDAIAKAAEVASGYVGSEAIVSRILAQKRND
jgi:hypothetical protein